MRVVLGLFQRNWTIYFLDNIMIGKELVGMDSILSAKKKLDVCFVPSSR